MLLHLFKDNISAVRHLGKKRNCYITPETGIFVTHSPTNTFAKNNYNNMFLNDYNTKILNILLAMCLLLTYKQHCLAAQLNEETTTTLTPFTPPTNRPSPIRRECGSLLLHHNCYDFHRLDPCTVILGHLSFTHFFGPHIECNKTFSFPNLREITGFLLMYKLENVTSIRDWFPNLTVIRGRPVFRNYGLIVSGLGELEKMEFKSLIAIQRGQILFDDLDSLCYADKIMLKRLALSKGNSYNFPPPKGICSKKASCHGCKRDACWSDEVCQLFEDDSVLYPYQNPRTDCHEQCLGGCYNQTAQGCVVCRGYTDHGTCVKKCTRNKTYPSLEHKRCYYPEECKKWKLYIFNKTCVESCPVGYSALNGTFECKPCNKNETTCTGFCDSLKLSGYTTIEIPDLGTAELFKNCEIFNGSLVFDMHEEFDQEELRVLFKNLKEITGFLKINRSPFLTNLDFLENLEKIHGLYLESDQFSLILYNNKRLQKLWKVKRDMEILNGGMYIRENRQLCSARIIIFQKQIRHDKSLDVIEETDLDVLCAPIKLNLEAKPHNHRSIIINWPIWETLSEVEIAYKTYTGEGVNYGDDLDPEVCNRIQWSRIIKFPDELEKNLTHYTYIIEDLEPNTDYAILVKTFSSESGIIKYYDIFKSAERSSVKYVTTLFDIPRPPNITLKAKTFDTLEIDFAPASSTQVVNIHKLEVYELAENSHLMEVRDFCGLLPRIYTEYHNEDYNECCTRVEKERKDQIFLSQLREEFSCSKDHQQYCFDNDIQQNDETTHQPFLRHDFVAGEKNHTISNLKPFHLYVLQLRACNPVGCSSHSILQARTNISLQADNIDDLRACRDNETHEYRFYFSQPKQENGYIYSYYVHVRNEGAKDPNHQGTTWCISRPDHERNHYVLTKKTNESYSQANVKVLSLGRNSFGRWVDITSCSSKKLSEKLGINWIWIAALIVFIIVAAVTWWSYKNGYFQDIYIRMRHMDTWSHDGAGLVTNYNRISRHSVPDSEHMEMQEIIEPE